MTFEEFIEKYNLQAKSTFSHIEKFDAVSEYDKLSSHKFVTLWWNVSISRDESEMQTSFGMGGAHIARYDAFNKKVLPKTKGAISLRYSVKDNSYFFDRNDGKLPKRPLVRETPLPGSNLPCFRPMYEDMLRDVWVPIAPILADVLNSLQSDCQCAEYDTFEDFARDMGYDSDSRKAEKVYDACREIRGKLRKLLTREQFTEFMECTES